MATPRTPGDAVPGVDDPAPGGGLVRLPARAPAAPPVGRPGKFQFRGRLSGRSAAGNAEHVVLVGSSQCRKSTAAHWILSGLRNLVIIDSARKGQFDNLGVVSEDPDAILRNPVVVWRPPLWAIDSPRGDFSDPWSTGLHYINTVRAQSGVTVFFDEPRKTMPVKPHRYVAEMVYQGMGRGIGVMAAPQGYSGIYRGMFDFAQQWFLFRVGSASERGCLAVALETDLPRLGQLKNGNFYHWRQGDPQCTGPFPVTDLGGRPPGL
jgi:hypothetical protein